MIIALFYWFLPKPYGARHFFTGPKRGENGSIQNMAMGLLDEDDKFENKLEQERFNQDDNN